MKKFEKTAKEKAYTSALSRYQTVANRTGGGPPPGPPPVMDADDQNNVPGQPDWHEYNPR